MCLRYRSKHYFSSFCYGLCALLVSMEDNMRYVVFCDVNETTREHLVSCIFWKYNLLHANQSTLFIVLLEQHNFG